MEFGNGWNYIVVTIWRYSNMVAFGHLPVINICNLVKHLLCDMMIPLQRGGMN